MYTIEEYRITSMFRVIEVPIGAEYLTAHRTFTGYKLFFRVPTAQDKKQKIQVGLFQSNEPINPEWDYLGSPQPPIDSDGVAWHIFVMSSEPMETQHEQT